MIVREPQKQQLLHLGAIELLNSNRLQHQILHLMIARTDVLKQKEDQITMLLTQFYKTQKYYLENEDDALSVMALRLPVFPYLLKESFKGARFVEPKDALMRLSGSPSNVEILAQNISNLMLEKEMIRVTPSDFKSLISTRILERIIYE